jgi:hypothetical protein
MSLTSKRKLTHAAIEYTIDAGEVMDGLDLFESAFRMTSESKVDLNWLVPDIPFYVDAWIAGGEDEKAKQVLQDARLGRQHPKTLMLGAKLLTLSTQAGRPTGAAALFKDLIPEESVREDFPGQACAKIFADIAQRFDAGQGLQAASLYAMAAQACRDQLSMADVVPTTGQPEQKALEGAMELRRQSDQNEFLELAVKALSSCAEKGMLQSPRARRWLSSSRELDILREREDFKRLRREIELAAQMDKAMRTAWNLATIDQRQSAEQALDQFAQEHPDLARLGGAHYLTARVWAACYESAQRQKLPDQAADYLSRCTSSLEQCMELGYFDKPENRSAFAADDNFAIVREKMSISLRE